MWTLTLNTIRELIRNKFFSLIIFFGVAFIAMTFVLKTLALGELERMMYDFGLSFIELSGLAVILLLGGGMIAREIEGRTIFLMLSKPVSRSVLFLGKFFGFGIVLLGIVIFQGLLLTLLLSLGGFSLDPLLFSAIIGIFLKLLSLLAVILFFSSFTSPMIAMFLTIATYMIGHSGYIMLDAARVDANTFLGIIGKVILILFPNLEALNLKNYVATPATINIHEWIIGYGASVVYIVVILSIGACIFSRRSFDNA